MRHQKILAVIIGALACTAVHAGDVYMYKDASGNTMYTDRPMPGAVRVSTAVQRPTEVAERNYAAQQSTNKQQLAASDQRLAQGKADQRAAAQVAKDLEASRAERCKQARDNYTAALNARRLYNEDKDGKRNYLSDAELAQERVEAQKAVESICGPQG